MCSARPYSGHSSAYLRRRKGPRTAGVAERNKRRGGGREVEHAARQPTVAAAHLRMSRSRVTFARIDAAAMQYTLASPPLIGST